MKNTYQTVVASFIIMVCIGGVYAWSTYVPHLREVYQFSSTQTQLIFGSTIAIFTTTMVLARKLQEYISVQTLVRMTAFLCFIGYLLVFLSVGHFWIIYLGIAVIGGIATGLGYLIAISIPARWFPHKKGLITGIVSAGFGGGAIFESLLAEKLFSLHFHVLSVLFIVGILSSILLFASSFFVYLPEKEVSVKPYSVINLIQSATFIRLFIGIFTGTFAGLMIISNLKPIGIEHQISYSALLWSISIFSIANLSGRFLWGFLNDYIEGKHLIPLSIFMIGIASYCLIALPLHSTSFIFFTFIIGFSFGANFVIYAKETAQEYGLEAIGNIYPLVFLGYGIAGLVGPMASGYLHDSFGNYLYAGYTALALCLVVGIGFIVLGRKVKAEHIQV